LIAWNERTRDDDVPLYTSDGWAVAEATERIRVLTERIAMLEGAIREHNDEMVAGCENEHNRRLRACDDFTQRGRQCPECPRDYLIDIAHSGGTG
jgi:hypothetical protein